MDLAIGNTDSLSVFINNSTAFKPWSIRPAALILGAITKTKSVTFSGRFKVFRKKLSPGRGYS